MALIDSFEKSGQWLFKYRGQLPVVLFFLALPVILTTDAGSLSDPVKGTWTIVAVTLSLLGLLFRAWVIGTSPGGTSGRNTQAQKAGQLNTTGAYSIARHPLYIGNFLIWVGIVAFTFNLWFFLSVGLLFWLYYERIMFAEECFLLRQFGEEYREWSQQVPAFLPSFKNYRASYLPFSIKPVLKKEYSGFMATITGFVYVSVVRDCWQAKALVVEPRSIWILGGAGVVTLVLRIINHRTGWLKKEGRP